MRIKQIRGAPPELINGCTMMSVCLVYNAIDNLESSRALAYLRRCLKDYKDYADEMRRCLVGCYEVLVENKTLRGEGVPEGKLERVKRAIASEMERAWGKKESVNKVVMSKKEEVTPDDDEYWIRKFKQKN